MAGRSRVATLVHGRWQRPARRVGGLRDWTDVRSVAGSVGGAAATGQVDRAVLLQMSRVSAMLYVSGGLLVLASLLVPAPGRQQEGLAAVAAAALVAGATTGLVGERVAIPAWVHVISAAFGSVVVALAAVLGGPRFADLYGIFYVYVGAFSFYFLGPRVAVGELLWAGAVYGVALAAVGQAGWVADGMIILGASVVGGGLIGTLGHRARLLLGHEHRVAARLRDLNQAKTLFLRTVSHDVRTPLAVLTTAAETLVAHADGLDRGTIRSLAERQVVQGRRLERLVGDFLDVERLSRGLLRPLPVPLRLDELVTAVVTDAEIRDHPLEMDLEPVEVVGDGAFLERVVDNLLVNAARHTAAGTPVAVTLRVEPGGALLAVEDRGGGVPEGDRETVFELFHRAGADGPGSGVGLALVRHMVEAHDGRVWVEDRPGGGASFRVWLPAEGAAAPVPGAGSAGADPDRVGAPAGGARRG